MDRLLGRFVDGLMDGWSGRFVDGWAVWSIGGSLDRLVYHLIDGYAGWLDKWQNRWIDEWIEK